MQSQSDLLPMTQNEIFLKYFDISEVIMEYYTKKSFYFLYSIKLTLNLGKLAT